MFEEAVSSKTLGLKLQPMVHVQSLSTALRFYEGLGAELMFGSRDGVRSVRARPTARSPGDGDTHSVTTIFCAETPAPSLSSAAGIDDTPSPTTRAGGAATCRPSAKARGRWSA